MSVLVETSFGDLTIDLQTDKFPTASFNFLKLCKLKHYNNALFINVQKGTLISIKISLQKLKLPSPPQCGRSWGKIDPTLKMKSIYKPKSIVWVSLGLRTRGRT